MPPRRSNRKKKSKVPGKGESTLASCSKDSQAYEVAKTAEASVSTKPTKPLRRSTRNVGRKLDQSITTRENELEDTIYDELLDIVDVNLDEQDEDHIPAIGVSIEAAHISAFPAAASTNPSPTLYTCEYCNNVLKSKHGFKKHVMAHRIKECNSKRPSAAILEPLMESFVVKSPNDIALEHGDEKQHFVAEVLKCSESGGTEWADFVSNISHPVLQSVSKPTKMLELNLQLSERHKGVGNPLASYI